MTSPNPPHTQIAPPSPPSHVAAQPQLRSLDDTIEHCIGQFGWTQFFQSTIISLAWFFDAQQTFITVFTDKEPKWSCKNSTLFSNNYSCKNYSNNNFCHLPKNAWSWDSPAHTSTVSEWSLTCAGPIITGLPASSFLLGCLIGGLVLATLADSSMGRKKMLVLSCVIMSISGGLTAISRNIWMYVGFRFMSGFGRSTIGTCAFVLASELVGKKWRGKIGIIGFTWFTFGFSSLPIIAFLLKGSSWRLIYLYTNIPCLFYSFLIYFLVYESPRWLFIKGRKEEFLKTVTSLVPNKERNISIEYFNENYLEWAEKLSQEENHFYSTLKILMSKSWALKRLLAVMAVGFGNGMAYYGSPLGLGNLPFNLYLSFGFNALSELMADGIMVLLIGKLRRKWSIIGLCFLSGICGVMSVFVRLKGLQMGLELLSFFCTCMVFDVNMIYTSELFPTCVRNSAVSMVREAGLLGGFLGPMIVAVGRRDGLFCYGVFGVAIFLCALLVIWMPETKGRKMCDTMEENEEECKDGEISNCVYC